ncbi:ribosome biogenesis protein [Niveomyces insectorum RCEF 264]|uniref:Ribosome biogenesis regulatory protein n=1 Tax=Niveomyces insectorum RCEF 264 TaxID=1081102 RepID=A0A162MBT5_9HYPO|nr:ribosome biogenesis protein [Niveomyces insectorum RCEF 264]
MASATAPARPSPPTVAVEKPTPYTFDLGLLLANDPNPIKSLGVAATAREREKQFSTVARDGAQALVNQLLTTCRIEPTAVDGVLLHLPPIVSLLPREKPVPVPPPPTKWQQFAARKGIKPKTREQRRNLRYNTEMNIWERKWGFRGANKAGEDDWVVEVKDNEKDAAHDAAGTSFRGEGRRTRKERVKRNERKMRQNQQRAEKTR